MKQHFKNQKNNEANDANTNLGKVIVRLFEIVSKTMTAPITSVANIKDANPNLRAFLITFLGTLTILGMFIALISMLSALPS